MNFVSVDPKFIDNSNQPSKEYKFLTTLSDPDDDVGQPVSFRLTIGELDSVSLFDTGSGANAVNPRYLRKQGVVVLERQKYKVPISIQVGNSQKLCIDETVRMSISHHDKSDEAWFLVIPELPMNLIIGRSTADRVKMGYKAGRVTWDNILLPVAETPTSINVMKADEYESSPPPVHKVKPEKRIAIGPRRVQSVKIKTDRKLWGKQGYINPVMRPNGTLLIMPGLVDFDDKGTAQILIFNPENKKKVIPAKNVIGDLYYITKRDAEETEIIELSDKSIIPSLNENNVDEESEPVPDEIPDKVKELIREIAENTRKSKEDNNNYQQEVLVNLLDTIARSKEEDNSMNVLDVLNLSSQEISKLFLNLANEDFSEFFQEDVENVIHMLTLGQMMKDARPPEDEKRKKIYEAFSLDKSNLSSSQKEQIIDLITEFDSIWDIGDKPPVQHTDTVEVSIPTGDHRPIRVPYRNTDPVEDEIIWKHIAEMAKRGVIRESKSPWAAPILLADKKNGKIRFCIDYRRLNKVTIQDAYPLPKMQDILKVLDNASLFSTLDLTDAFWSIKVRDEDIEKTAFASRHGLWEFISMPFGLTNAPATQQRFIEAVLNGLLWTCCFAYIDDILCFSKTFERHLIDLRSIFERLRNHKLKIQPSKCTFCHSSFEILGFVTTKDGLKPSPKKVEAMKQYPYPKTVKETQSFLGIVSWLRRFIPQCSQRTKNLRICAQLPPKKFELSKLAQREVDDLKKIITNDTCMAHPRQDEQFYIHVDASGVGLGAILTQLDKNEKHRVVEYASKALNRLQSKQTNAIREALGVLWALTHFKYYIRTMRPIVFTDCSCLSTLAKDEPDGTPRIAALRSWIARLMYFQPKLVHRPGKLMAIPDALSRHFVNYLPDEDDKMLPASEILGQVFEQAANAKEDYDKNLQMQDNLLDLLPDNDTDEFEGTMDIPMLCNVPTNIVQKGKEKVIIGDMSGQKKTLFGNNKVLYKQDSFVESHTVMKLMKKEF